MKKLLPGGLHLSLLLYCLPSLFFFSAMHRNIEGVSSGLAFGFPVPAAFLNQNLLLPAILLFFACYLSLLFFARTGEVRFRELLFACAAVCIPLLFLPHLLSSDVFDYIIHGRMVVVHGANAYLHSISEFTGDPFAVFTCWKNYPSVYGPAWMICEIALVLLSKFFHAGVFGHVLMFKVFAALLHLLNGRIVWLASEYAWPRKKIPLTVLYLFNPLLLIEFAGNAHNDVLLVTFLLAGVYFLLRGKDFKAVCCFNLAVLTKFYAAPGLFLILIFLLTQKKRTLKSLLQVVLAVCLPWLLYVPFWAGIDTFQGFLIAPGNTSFTKSIAEFLFHWTGGDRRLLIQRSAQLFSAALLIVCAWSARSIVSAIKAVAWFFFFWCCLGATWFMPWYATIFVSLAAVSASPAAAAVSVLFSFTTLLIYAVETGGLAGFMSIYYAPVLFGLPLALVIALTAWELARRTKERASF